MADSTTAIGTPVTPALVSRAADAFSANGNGHSEVVADSGVITMFLDDPAAVVTYTGNGDSGLTTGYIQSDTTGRGVIRITTNQVFTYTGTGSTLVGLTNATEADTLFIASRSLAMTTGTLTALGVGSTALDVTANGGAGLGSINVSVNGDILSAAGSGMTLDQNNVAATGNVVLTSTAGNTITSGAGNAVTILTSGSGTLTVDLADTVTAGGGDGIVVLDEAAGGDISIRTAAVSALSAGSDAIDARSASLAADLTIVANGALNASDEGIVAAILESTATGNISITTNSSVNAGNNGIEAMNSGSGSTTINATGTITANAGDGILALSSGGAIAVTTSNLISAAAEQGIDLQQTDAGGSGALSVTASGDVSGTDAIRALNSGTGAVTIHASGSLTGIAGDAILIVSTNAVAGAISVTTTAGEVLSAKTGAGIDVHQSGTGNVGVINAAAINSGSIANTLHTGIDVNSSSTGNITINNSGAIGTAGDRTQECGINAAITNAASAGILSVAGMGSVFSANSGVDVFTSGTGAASVIYGGAISSSTGDGIQVDTTSGNITVTNGGAINADGGNGIRTISTTGNQTITVNGAVNGGVFDGVRAASTSGTIIVDVNGANVTGADDAVHVTSDGAKTVTVATGRTLTGGDLGIASTGTGATTINNSGTITGTGVAIRSETSATTLNNLAGGTINGAVFLSDLNDVINNAGTIVGALTLGAGADLYDGRDGSISGTVNGGDGNDTLLGGAGADRMIGGLGADILEGNGGADKLTGGADNDTFRGTAASLNGDTIADFAAGDSILISNVTLAGFSFSLSGNTLTYTGGSLTLTGFTGQLQAAAAAGGGVELTIVGASSGDARSDFNGDGRSDIFWRHGSGEVITWAGQESGGFVANGNANAGTDWNVVATGDYDGDGLDDVLWRNDNGDLTDWLGQADGTFASNFGNAFYQVATDWTVAGTGDFNGDGRSDIFWRHTSGEVITWAGQESGGFVANGNANAGTDWHVVGTGDYNGDGRDDILWRNDNGDLTDWLGQADGTFASNFGNAFYQVATDWTVAGTGDFNGDGRSDIFWRHESGEVITWAGQESGGFVANGNANAGTDWNVVATGDYNGDGRDDVLWRNDNGDLTDWLGQADGTFASNFGNAFYQVATDWTVQPPGGSLLLG